MMIYLDSITYGYGQGVPIFHNYTWQIERGEAWAILGPSGCGKTTLLYLLSGLRFPNAGRLLIDNEPLLHPRPRTGLILQDYGLLPWATVRQNVELGLQVRNFYGPDGKHAPADFRPSASVDLWLERLGLSDFAGKYPGQLSGGQRQRTAIARTLVLNPDLLLMDEPFSSLDAPTRESLQNLTLDLKAEQNLSLIIVTHAIEEAAVMGRKILLLGSPPNEKATILENPESAIPDFRNSPAYFDLCRCMRKLLEPAG